MKTLNEIQEMIDHQRVIMSNTEDRIIRIIAEETMKTLMWVIDYKTLDPIVQEVCDNLQRRSRLGQAKYGTTLFDSKEDELAWLNHMQEEQFDNILYIEKYKQLKSEEK